MVDPILFQISNLDTLIPAGAVVRLIVASMLGGAIGLEREWRHKASGLRTNMLMCLACALFTVMSIVLAGSLTPNKSQIASNIVQGVGFLGAGLILHTRSQVLGLTSAATVFTVAGIGMACGAGLYMEAIAATLIVLVSLRLIGFMETKLPWKQSVLLYEVRGQDKTIMFAALLEVMDRHRMRMNVVERDSFGAIERVTFTVTANRVKHNVLLADLQKCDLTDQVHAFPDVDQD
jgi:putative Mg2+ transporter-C (MgtC) family protein